MEKKKKNRILNVLIVIAVIVLIYAAYQLIQIFYAYYQNRQVQSGIQDIFYQNSVSEDSDQEGNQMAGTAFDLKLIQELNQDTVGWLVIPNTVIDYPVVQATDNDYYLTNNFYHEYSAAGSIFMDYMNREVGFPRQNVILYGHRMKDGSMFGDLGEFLDAGFFKENQIFTYIDDDGIHQCQIFSVYQCTTEVDYAIPFFADDDAFLSYVADCRGRSVHQTNIEITAEDTIITLSTCDYVLDPNEGRLVVQAKVLD